MICEERRLYFLLVTWLLVGVVQTSDRQGEAAQDENNNALDDETLQQKLVSDIEYFLECRKPPVPGLSVSVVLDGRQLLVRGFGSARLRQEDSDKVDRSVPVTENTKFAIGSLSKAFTATLIGILLNEQHARFPERWDTRVVDVMGSDFRFVDDLRTQQTTIRDLLAQRTGLPAYKMALTLGLETHHSRQDYCMRMRYMDYDDEETTSFRDKFTYNDLMYLLAGCVAERLGNGHPLERLMVDKLFTPLSMNDTRFISEMKDSLDNDSSLATMYYWNSTNDQLLPLSNHILRTVFPLDAAGGVITTAADMTCWLEFQLSRGRDRAGNQLLPLDYWLEIHSPQMVLDQELFPVVRPSYPASDTHSAYGFGWRLGLYRGRLKSEHAGHLAAFYSKLTILHSEKLSVFTVSNGPLYSERDVYDALHFLILDTVTASNRSHRWGDERWLNETTACIYPEPWLSLTPPSFPASQHTNPPSYVVPERPPDGWLLHAHRMYTGRYGHLLLGNFTVTFQPTDDTVDGGMLLFKVGSIGRGRLTYTDGLTWLMQFDDIAYFCHFGAQRGVPLPIIFHDQAPADQHSVFNAVVIISFEPVAPPVFRRNLLWNDEGRTSTASRMRQFVRVLVKLTVLLTIDSDRI